MNLLTAVVGVGIGVLGITHRHRVRRSVRRPPRPSPLMLGLAVGIDYALFIVSRYRQELRRGRDGRRRGRPPPSAPPARPCSPPGSPWSSRWPGWSVVGIPFLTQMGVAAAGHRRRRRAGRAHPRAGRARLRSAARAAAPAAAPCRSGAPPGRAGRGFLGALGRRWSPATACDRARRSAVLGAIAVPAFSMRTDAGAARRPRDSTRPARPTTCSPSGFGPGFNGPLAVLSSTAPARPRRPATAGSGSPASDDVALVTPPRARTPTARAALVTVIPESGADRPGDRASSSHDLRDRARRRSTARTSSVTGDTAVSVDVVRAARRRAAGVPGARRRPGAGAADAGLPLAAGAARRRRWASCSPSAPRSAPPSRCSSGAGWPTWSACTAPGR